MNVLEKLIGILRPPKSCSACYKNQSPVCQKKIAIVGSPNVGKSITFNCLTGSYANVSNYPGTTVEVFRGKTRLNGEEFEVIDTPGMYSLMPISEEERVARNILLDEKPVIVLHIIDAKNLDRMLPFTLQLIEAGLPVILVLNIMDEAEKLGMKINVEVIERELKIPVVATVSVRGEGIGILKRKMEEYVKNPKNFSKISEMVDFSYTIALRNQERANNVVEQAMEWTPVKGILFRERLSRIVSNPVTGLPIMLLVLYFGIYKFVAGFGAGVLVDFIEKDVFERNINPFVVKVFSQIVSSKIVSDLFVGEYGIITLGLRYAVALIFPIVTTFFIAFAIIEDSGYLPRLALLIDRLFKKIGLTGRAVIPMVLGLGCDTMATMVTRTLPTKREKLIATILLALAVPCSAQLGVILSLLDGNPKGLLIWAGAITLVFVFVGFVSSKILPGDNPSFYMEVPPLRFPNLSNVFLKTWTRVKWYFVEIFPVFILVSVFIWIGQLTGVFDFLIALLTHPIRWIGLPDETAVAFLFGFFRRDYGAGGLYDIKMAGLFTDKQLVVACITLTLFLPCIAQFLVNIKERGWKTAVGISVFVLFFSFSVGFLVNLILGGI